MKEKKKAHEDFDKSFNFLVENLKHIRKSHTQIGFAKVKIDGVIYISIAGKLDFVKDFFAENSFEDCYDTLP